MAGDLRKHICQRDHINRQHGAGHGGHHASQQRQQLGTGHGLQVRLNGEPRLHAHKNVGGGGQGFGARQTHDPVKNPANATTR